MVIALIPATRHKDLHWMSTFMGLAWIDLIHGADLKAATSALAQSLPADVPIAGALLPEQPDGRTRIETIATYGNIWIGEFVVAAARRSGLVERAFIALDHDEYGAEHIILDGRGGTVRRVHHIYVYPRAEDTGELYIEDTPSLMEVPPAVTPEPSEDPGAVVDGVAAHAAAAALYGVPAERMERAAVAAADVYKHLGTVGATFDPWLDALGLRWVGDCGGEQIELRRE
jgi:hypothetical protein